MISAIWKALSFSFGMTWEILWALIIGFALSAVVQAVVKKSEMMRLLPDDSPRSLAIACGLGAASSSCSYAAVALARSLFRKGSDFTAAMAFEFASTNLVIELGIILALLMGWQFTAAEFVGGPVMVIVLALLFRGLLRPKLLEAARKQAERGLAGVMEGHAAMDMSVHSDAPLLKRATSKEGITAISHYFIMDWGSIYKDIAIGLLIAGALAAWVPNSFWQAFFLVKHPVLSKIWGPLVGPIVSMLSFVCSIGNVPLAAVLWKGGISFGGIVAFIFADLIILPILNIYRKYYGAKMSLFLLGTFYIAMATAGYVIEILFGALGLIPGREHIRIMETHITFNYTTILNALFLILSALLFIRFMKTGGPQMMRMMDEVPDLSEPEDAGPETELVYVCPMHPEVRKAGPGSCPHCHMKLVAESQSDAIQVSERSDRGEMEIDPVCGMEVDPHDPPGGTYTFEGKAYFFCSSGCRDRFRQDPRSFTQIGTEQGT